MAIKRIMIAAFTFAVAQSAFLVKSASASPFTGASRLKGELSVKPGHTLRQRLPAIKKRFALPPNAFVNFCRRKTDQCAVRQGKLAVRDGVVIATPAVLSSLISINTQVNKTIRSQSDGPRQDVWEVNVMAGDCEDYVLTKRAQLLAKGWPSSALAIAVVYTPKRIGHAVLVARTDAGEFVLDNLRGEIITREKSDYHFISMQDGSRRLGWVAL